MSYVLEALRRAEAERHSGTVPDLHAPVLSPLREDAAATPAPRWLWPMAVGALGLLLAGLLAWQWWAPTAPLPMPMAEPRPPVATNKAPASAAVILPRAAVPPRPVSRLPAEPAAAPAPKPAAPGAEAAAVVPLAQLPDALRRQLPALVFGGATDSTSASSRMLIINGQIFREGEEPAPGLVLERITLRSAQMRFKGRRFEVAY